MCDHRSNVAEFWSYVQKSLFPGLEEAIEAPLSEAHRLLVWVIEIVRPEQFLPSGLRWRRVGAPEIDRTKIATAFLAKAVMNLPTTKALRERLLVDGVLRRLCGWERRVDVPSESTFSRAFALFAQTRLLDRLHEALAKRELSGAIVWTLSRDATAINGREKPERKTPAGAPVEGAPVEGAPVEGAPVEGAPVEGANASSTPKRKPGRPKKSGPAAAPAPAPKRKRGRPKKGEVVPPPEPKRIDLQRTQTLEEAIAGLPTGCNKGKKNDSHGNPYSWIGFALHADLTEDGLPASVLTTSASLHDSQVAIPLTRTSRGRIGTIFYELMDPAYDAPGIRAEITEAGSTPIIDKNKRRGPTPPPMEPDRARIYQGRSVSERFNSDLKDNHGGRTVRVRGYAKVHCHLMFGVLVIFAKMLLAKATA